MPPGRVGFNCAMCLLALPLTECKLLHCYHGFCDECVNRWLEWNRVRSLGWSRQLNCPTCRKPAYESDLGRIFVETVVLDGGTEQLTAGQEAKGEEVKEPQNPLTRKFTEAEWKALRELRAMLPYIFATAFPEKDNKLSPVVLWGVPIDPLNPVADTRISVVLVRFLRARNLDVGKATKMMISTFKWRDEFKMDRFVTEEPPRYVFGRAGNLFGMDKDGRPVTYNIYGGKERIVTVFASVFKYERWRLQLMERAIHLIDFVNVDSMVQVHDYKGADPWSSVSSLTAIFQTWGTPFQDCYPDEFLFKMFFINVPTHMIWVFWLLKPLIPASTLAKLSVVGSDARTIRETLLPTIDARELPKRYGGQAEAF